MNKSNRFLAIACFINLGFMVWYWIFFVLMTIERPTLAILYLGPVAINFLAADLSEKRTNLATVLALVSTLGFLATFHSVHIRDGLGYLNFIWVVPVVNVVGIIEMNVRSRMGKLNDKPT